MTASSEFCAGDPALDFLNTREDRGSRPHDELASPQALLAWLERAGLMEASVRRTLASSPPDLCVLLGEARALRREIRVAIHSLHTGARLGERCLFALNRVLASGERLTLLEREAAGVRIVERRRVGPVRARLAPLAEAAAHLLVDGDPERIRQCRAEDCERWFLDSSKNGTRKWCSMSRCGNRAKAAAHYRRHHPG